MWRRACTITVFLVAAGRAATAQTVSTLATGFRGGALLVEPSGDILVSDYLGGSERPDRPRGTVVRRVTVGGQTSTLIGGLFAPTGLARDAGGALYVATATRAQNDTGIIMRRATDGSVRRFADGMKALAALLVLSTGDLLAASPTAGVIYRISPAGSVSVFARDSALAGVTGLALLGETVLASTFYSGRLFRVSANAAPVLLARLGGPLALKPVNYLTAHDGAVWANVGSNELSRGDGHRVVRVSMGGTVTAIAGNGEGGSRDGPAAESRFLHNAGIGFSPDGAMLYVSDWNGIRVIRLR